MSLLLGLVTGPVQVEVAVDPAVAAVVLELDGARVGELSGPPWALSIDLGEELAPRRLEARALDAGGTEIDRATRYLNVYRPPAGVEYVVHRNPDGWVTMISLDWGSRAGARPRRSAVAVGGRPVDFEDPGEIWLPPLDPSELHVIEAVAEYADGVVTRDRIGVGGPVLGESSARVTPVSVTVADRSAALGPGTVSARLAGGGEPVRIVGIERGDSEIVVVRDEAARRAVERIGPARGSMGALGGGRDAQAARVIRSVPLVDTEWVRLLDATVSDHPGPSLDPHAVAVPLLSHRESGFGLFWHLKSPDPGSDGESGGWIADAVAVAGGRAAYGGRRRAAVLVLAPRSADEGSRLAPPSARGYLRRLGVPLFVWYVGQPAKAPEEWGPAVGVRSVSGMQEALDALRAELEHQRIVWVEGVHLPDEVEVERGPGAGSTPGDAGAAGGAGR